MTQQQAQAPSRYVEWARKGLSKWHSARKRAIQLWLDGKPVKWICTRLRVSRQWLWKWIHRYQAEGWPGLEDRSSRPHRIQRKRDAYVKDVLAAKEQYPHLGVVKLRLVAKLGISHNTIHRILRDHNACKRVKRPRKQYTRFERPYPNYLWQLDITMVPTKTHWVHIATIIDDNTRAILASKCYAKDLNQGDTIDLVRSTVKQWGPPHQILTDRGSHFTTTAEEPSWFTRALDAWGIQHIMGRPRHPQTQGKIERWHGSLKHEWLAHHPIQDDIQGVKQLLNDWVEHYNTERPHWAIDLQIPLEAYFERLSKPASIQHLVNEVKG